jgi:hypothetical protein
MAGILLRPADSGRPKKRAVRFSELVTVRTIFLEDEATSNESFIALKGHKPQPFFALEGGMESSMKELNQLAVHFRRRRKCACVDGLEQTADSFLAASTDDDYHLLLAYMESLPCDQDLVPPVL